VLEWPGIRTATGEIEYLRAERVEAVLTDVSVVPASCGEFIHGVRRRPYHAATPVIAVTG